MNWYKSKIPNTEHQKQWHAERGRYIVRWRDQFLGVNIPEGYQALFHNTMPDGTPILDVVWKFKVFRTRKAAFDACEDHLAGLNPAAMAKERKMRKKKVRRFKKIKPAAAMIETVFDAMPPAQRKPRSDKGKPREVNIVVNCPPINANGLLLKKRGRPKGSKNSKPRSDKGKHHVKSNDS